MLRHRLFILGLALCVLGGACDEARRSSGAQRPPMSGLGKVAKPKAVRPKAAKPKAAKPKAGSSASGAPTSGPATDHSLARSGRSFAATDHGIVPGGRSFAGEVRTLYTVLTCPPGASPPARVPKKLWARYCQRVRPALMRQRVHARRTMMPYLAGIQPATLPDHVVYPFGGADLVTALTTFPAAREITTLSLEHAGDPRPLVALRGEALRRALATMGARIAAFFGPTTSKSTTLMTMQRGAIPGELAFFMGALAVHGYRPVDLRYFRVEVDGTLHYYTAEEIGALEARRARKLASGWRSPGYSPAFSNSELVFERIDGKGGRRVHRHLAANLANDALAKRLGLLAHLEAKGKVAVMTKAASYLLWRPSFSRIRRYLVTHLAWMISDSTGIPPRIARAAGLVQETHGRYRRCFFSRFDKRIDADFAALWRGQPYRRLAFRYGYPDGRGAYHLMVTRPKGR